MGTLAVVAAGGGVVGICAIDGMAGIGKTTFAVHAAHRLAGTFPDGQFFLPLHAHTAGQRPVGPADALGSLLLAAGVPAAQIPPGLEARVARWRGQVAGKKILLLLDDAAGHEQVRPLLPGTADSLVLVTSRRRLTALDDTAVITLDPMPPAQAAALLARLAARAGISAADPAVGELARLGGYLPLAIGMLASQLRHHPAWTRRPGHRPGRARDRLALMRAENLSVAAAFGLSYHDLTSGQRRLFRRLGLIPGSSFDAYAAAALDGTTLDVARRGLEDLYDQHLLTEPALAATSCTTCSANTPAPLPPTMTQPTPTPPPAGYWTTTCTPPSPPAGTSAPAPVPTGAPRPAIRRPRPPTCLLAGRRAPGWRPSARTCTPPRIMPPTAHVSHMPSPSPSR